MIVTCRLQSILAKRRSSLVQGKTLPSVSSGGLDHVWDSLNHSLIKSHQPTRMGRRTES